MGDSSDSGFGKKTHVQGPSPKTDPGAKPLPVNSLANPVTSSAAFRDWVRADMEYKENMLRPKYS